MAGNSVPSLFFDAFSFSADAEDDDESDAGGGSASAGPSWFRMGGGGVLKARGGMMGGLLVSATVAPMKYRN